MADVAEADLAAAEAKLAALNEQIATLESGAPPAARCPPGLAACLPHAVCLEPVSVALALNLHQRPAARLRAAARVLELGAHGALERRHSSEVALELRLHLLPDDGRLHLLRRTITAVVVLLEA